MERRGEEVHVETTEASGGSKEGVVRWVLIIGTLLAIVLLSVIWMTGAAFQGQGEEEGDVSGQIQSMERDGSATDSIVSDKRQFETIERDDKSYDGMLEVEPNPATEEGSSQTAPQE